MPSTGLDGFTHQKGLAFYLDTSAARPLVLTATGKVTGVEAGWVSRLTNFIAKAQAAQSRVLCSILVVEELASSARNKALAAHATANGHASWKDFKAADQTKAAAAQKAVQADVLGILKLADKELKTYSISVEYPLVRDATSSQAGIRLRAVHQTWIAKYPMLDAMDAMHITFGAELGCKHFVSFDEGWNGIAEIMRLH